MLSNKLANDKNCTLCKVVSGSLFLLAGTLHGFRVKSIWSFYPAKEKVFNLFAVGILYGIAYLNYKAGYESYLG